MEEYKNTVDLDGCNYDVTYIADPKFEKIEIVKVDCNGNDFTNILSEEEKQRLIEILT
jgi:hypothetical protein